MLSFLPHVDFSTSLMAWSLLATVLADANAVTISPGSLGPRKAYDARQEEPAVVTVPISSDIIDWASSPSETSSEPPPPPPPPQSMTPIAAPYITEPSVATDPVTAPIMPPDATPSSDTYSESPEMTSAAPLETETGVAIDPVTAPIMPPDATTPGDTITTTSPAPFVTETSVATDRVTAPILPGDNSMTPSPDDPDAPATPSAVVGIPPDEEITSPSSPDAESTLPANIDTLVTMTTSIVGSSLPDGSSAPVSPSDSLVDGSAVVSTVTLSPSGTTETPSESTGAAVQERFGTYQAALMGLAGTLLVWL